MEALLLNTKFESVSMIDSFKSFIWTDRYDECGDFEIYVPINDTVLKTYKEDYYLWNNDSEHVMILEQTETKTDIDEGDFLVISGRSLESILERRVVWKETILEGSFQEGIHRLLNENVINPTIAARRIDNFIFEASDDPKITGLTIDAKYTGDNLYTVINTLCREEEIGFKITLNSLNQFVFKLYAGVDRSYNQTTNPYVIFSEKYDNLVSSSHIKSKKTLKNVAYVVGGEIDSIEYTHTVGFSTGMERREVYVDATSLSTDDEDGNVMSPTRYDALLKHRGIDELIDNVATDAFEAEVDATTMFVYGKDFFVGDIVQVVDKYGQEGRVYISELIFSQDGSGTMTYPTFKTIQEGVYE